MYKALFLGMAAIRGMAFFALVSYFWPCNCTAEDGTLAEKKPVTANEASNTAMSAARLLVTLARLPAVQADLKLDKVVIIGVHTPETSAERQFAGLQGAVQEQALKFPVAVDLKAETWKAWGNSVWPAVYLIDRQGDVRYSWTGELKWQGAAGDKLMREHIEQLLAEKD